MPGKKYIVELDWQERQRLNALITKGKASAKTILKARVLLKADCGKGGPGWLDAEIIAALDTSLRTVMRVREKLVTEGLDAVLTRKKRETPPVAPIYEAFKPDDARRIAERFEWHYTPKHGSWLNLAESELAVLASQCLARRIPDQAKLTRQVNAWLTHRNAHNAKANWHFTTADARIKLKNLYPSI